MHKLLKSMLLPQTTVFKCCYMNGTRKPRPTTSGMTWKYSVDDILGKLRQKRSNAWISNETINIAASKREARKRGNVTEYKRLRNEVQRHIRRDKNSWLENECKALDQYDRTGKARQLFEKSTPLQSNLWIKAM